MTSFRNILGVFKPDCIDFDTVKNIEQVLIYTCRFILQLLHSFKDLKQTLKKEQCDVSSDQSLK